MTANPRGERGGGNPEAKKKLEVRLKNRWVVKNIYILPSMRRVNAMMDARVGT